MWLVSAWGAWAIRRKRSVLVGFLPTVVVLASTALYVGEEPRILLAPLGAALASDGRGGSGGPRVALANGRD